MHIADRGHKHSEGRSIVCFYLTLPTCESDSSDEVGLNDEAETFHPMSAGVVAEPMSCFKGEWRALPLDGWQSIHGRFLG